MLAQRQRNVAHWLAVKDCTHRISQHGIVNYTEGIATERLRWRCRGQAFFPIQEKS
jgi:hypothetical protein